MSWWEALGSWVDGFYSNIWRIKNELWDWVDNIARYWVRNITDVSGAIDSIKNALHSWVDSIAEYWVRRADEYFDILTHSWSDVINEIESRVKTWEELKEQAWEWLKPKIDAFIITWEEEKGVVWNYIQDKILDNIVEWITDRFENVLDKVFEK